MKNGNKYLIYATGLAIGLGIIWLIHRRMAGGTNAYDLTVFDSPDHPGSGKNMKSSFLNMLRKAEKIAGFRFSFNSAFRTPNYNRRVGGVSNSAHLYGLAVDIRASSIAIRDKIVKAAKEAGFKRIGIGSNFVHLDNDSSKPQYVAWGYPIGSRPPYNPFA